MTLRHHSGVGSALAAPAASVAQPGGRSGSRRYSRKKVPARVRPPALRPARAHEGGVV